MESAKSSADFPKLKNFKPTKFMLQSSQYDKQKADRAVKFVELLCHTKGEWSGKPFLLLPWEEEIIRNIFGVVKADGTRQFKTAFIKDFRQLRRRKEIFYFLH